MTYVMEGMSYANPPQNYDDPHRHNPGVHYRLHDGRSGPTVICVQDFDYLDYDGTKFLGPEAWDTEDEAMAALRELLRPASAKLMTRAVVVDHLRPGDIADVEFDPAAGALRVVKYRQPFD